jgi:hypothetical protein
MLFTFESQSVIIGMNAIACVSSRNAKCGVANNSGRIARSMAPPAIPAGINIRFVEDATIDVIWSKEGIALPEFIRYVSNRLGMLRSA